MRMLSYVNPTLHKLEAALVAAPQLDVTPVRSVDELAARMEGIEALVVSNMVYDQRLSALLSDTPSLRWVQATSSGVDRLLANPPPAGVVITNAAGIKSEPVAEHALALLLGLARQLHRSLQRQRGRVWDKTGLATGMRSLHGMHIVCLGYGAVGQAFARKAKALGARVTALNRSGSGGPPADQVDALSRLSDHLPTAEAVVLCLPLARETRHILGKVELARLRPDALIVNIGRGELIDEAALADALARGALAGAGLDVFHSEPLPAESPLWDLDSVILTPHVAGHGIDADGEFVRLVIKNAARIEQGRPLLNVVPR